MRDVAEVLTRIISEIPDGHPVKRKLERIREASYFKAPELMRDIWVDAANALETGITPEEFEIFEWPKTVQAIFADRE
jgi:hypothetical protein